MPAEAVALQSAVRGPDHTLAKEAERGADVLVLGTVDGAKIVK